MQEYRDDGKSSPAMVRSLMAHAGCCSLVATSSPCEGSHCSLPQTSTHFLPVPHSHPLEVIWDDLPHEQICFPPLLCPTINDLR